MPMLVYGGFAWQGVFLGAAFLLHARERWTAAMTAPAPADARPLFRVLVRGGVTLAVLTALLQVVVGTAVDEWAPAVVALSNAAFALLGAGGILALVSGRPSPRWLVVAAAWTGRAAIFSWVGTADCPRSSAPAMP